GRIDLHDWWIAEIEFLARNTGDERARHGYARRFRRCVGLLADFEVPHRSADINDAGYAAANIARELVVEMRFDPRDFLFVRAHTVEIRAVWPREQISRLKEVNMCVDVTGQNK